MIIKTKLRIFKIDLNKEIIKREHDFFCGKTNKQICMPTILCELENGNYYRIVFETESARDKAFNRIFEAIGKCDKLDLSDIEGLI